MTRMANISKSNYVKLVANISTVYEHARAELVRAYWEIGRFIVEALQEGRAATSRGEGVIKKLSSDLTIKYGVGFSKPSLERMRLFYLQNRYASPARRITWSHYVELLSVKDSRQYKSLVNRAEKENLTVKDLRRIIKAEIKSEFAHSCKKLEIKIGKLFTYSVSKSRSPRGYVTIDCGFHIEKQIKKSELENISIAKSTYTYRGLVDKVVDGDTVRVRIDCGFGIFTRESLRLRGLNTAELGTPDGEQAKRWLSRRLKPNQVIVLRTYSTDMYHRYIADIFYLPKTSNEMLIASSGVFLNQEIIDSGLSV